RRPDGRRTLSTFDVGCLLRRRGWSRPSGGAANRHSPAPLWGAATSRRYGAPYRPYQRLRPRVRRHRLAEPVRHVAERDARVGVGEAEGAAAARVAEGGGGQERGRGSVQHVAE